MLFSNLGIISYLICAKDKKNINTVTFNQSSSHFYRQRKSQSQVRPLVENQAAMETAVQLTGDETWNC